jgi:copper(I)-binding protein
VFDAYRVRLVGLTSVIRAGTTIPVTFVFDRAGRVTVETIVQPSVPRSEPSTRCVPG